MVSVSSPVTSVCLVRPHKQCAIIQLLERCSVVGSKYSRVMLPHRPSLGGDDLGFSEFARFGRSCCLVAGVAGVVPFCHIWSVVACSCGLFVCLYFSLSLSLSRSVV